MFSSLVEYFFISPLIFHNLFSCPFNLLLYPAFERKDTVPLHTVTWNGPMSVLPPIPSIPVRCDPNSREGLPPSGTKAGEEVDEWVQVHLLHRHAPLGRPRHHRLLRQKVRTNIQYSTVHYSAAPYSSVREVQYALQSLYKHIAPSILPLISSSVECATIFDTIRYYYI